MKKLAVYTGLFTDDPNKLYGDIIHYTHDKHLIDVDVLIDDSPEKLKKFTEASVSNGKAICMKQSWNKQCQNSTMSIDRLSDITTMIFE